MILIVLLPGNNGENNSSLSGESEQSWYYGSGIETADTNSGGYFFGNGDKNTSFPGQNQNSSQTSSLNNENKINSSDKNDKNSSYTTSPLDESKVECPDLIGFTLSYAKNTLENAGLKLGKITYKSSTDYLPGYVMEQSIPVGALIDKGRTVDIVVCKNDASSEVNVTLPEVKDKNMLTAGQILKSAGFKNIEYVFVTSSAPVGNVTNVSVEGTITYNSKITLTVSGKKAVVDDYYGKTVTEIKNNYSNILFEIKTEDGSPIPEDAYGDYKVSSQSISAGTVGYEGMTVTLTVVLN